MPKGSAFTFVVLGALAALPAVDAKRPLELSRHSHALHSLRGNGDERTSDSPDGGTAMVMGDDENMFYQKNPPGADYTAELLHFVTPYHMGFESLVDVTPYSQLLRAVGGGSAKSSSLAENATSSSAKGSIGFYAFIDTWVGDHHDKMKTKVVQSSRGQCELSSRPERDTSGNGFALTAELVFWPKAQALLDTRPRHSITLSSGYFGGTYKIGQVSVHEGTVTKPGTVHLDEPADFTNTIDAACYACREGAETLKQAKQLGADVQEVKRDGASLDELAGKAYDRHVSSNLQGLKPTRVNQKHGVVDATYDPAKVKMNVGMPVYLQPGDVPGASLKPVGKVTAVGKDNSVRIQMESSGCLPMAVPTNPSHGANASLAEISEAKEWLPRITVPSHSGVVPLAQAIADGLRNHAIGAEVSRHASRHPKNTSDGVEAAALLDKGSVVQLEKASLTGMGRREVAFYEHIEDIAQLITPSKVAGGKVALVQLPFLGDVALNGKHKQPPKRASLLETSTRAVSRAGERVCLLKEDRTGRLFQRKFALPPMGKDDTALLHLAVTGHGWEKTQDGCGEYCYAVYRLFLNGVHAHDVTQWRSDCAENPTGRQDGTYNEMRNGWCPGSVQTGSFLDVTKHLKTHASKTSENTLTVNVEVYDAKRKVFRSFMDKGGFLNNDQAVLDTAANLFVYDSAAVDAVRRQPAAYTAAEKALREGANTKLFVPPNGNEQQTEYASQQSSSLFESAHEGVAAGSAHGRRQGQQEFAASPGELELPVPPVPSLSSALSEFSVETSSGDAAAHKPLRTTGAARVDFEARQPWYQFRDEETMVNNGVEPVVVPVFQGEYMHIDHRIAQSFVLPSDIPKEWSQVALRFKLDHPKNLDFDFWDRIGSFGFTFDGSDVPGVDLQRLPQPGVRTVTLSES